MATCNYYLKEPEAEKSLILLFIREGNKTLKVSTGERIPTICWDQNKQRLRKSSKFRQSPELNYMLGELKSLATTSLLKYKGGGKGVDVEELKETLKAFLNKAEIKDDSFFVVYEEFLKHLAVNRHPRTVQKYKTLKAHLIDFQKKKNFKIDFDKINLRFYDLISEFYIKDQGRYNNTFGKYISAFKTYMTWALDRGHHANLTYKKFAAPKEDTDFVYLTTEELDKLYQFDLSGNKRLENVRDVFCICCYTGLRFSDVAQLKKEHIKKDSILVRTYKTDEIVKVPLRQEARSIIEKYFDEPYFLPVISNQNTNDYLKELGKRVGIDETVTLSKNKGANRDELSGPKYKFLGTHTGRRTFIIQSLEDGIRPEVVMQVTAHKSMKSFKKYIKITEKVAEVEFNRAWDRKKTNREHLKIAK